MASFYINAREEIYLPHLHKKIDPTLRADSEIKLPGWIASEHCNFFSSSPPVRKKTILLKTLPYMLEDQLINSVESYHFTVIMGKESEPVWTCVTTNENMKRWKEMLMAAGIKPTALYADIYALPYRPHLVSVYIGEDRCLARTSQHEGFCGRGETFFQFLQKTLQGPKKDVEIITDGRTVIPEQYRDKVVEETESWLHYLSQASLPNSPANMFHGDFAAEQKSAHSSLYRTLGWAAMLLFVVFTARQTAFHMGLNQEIQRQKQKNTVLYEQMFSQPLADGTDLRPRALETMNELAQRDAGAKDGMWELAVSLAEMLNQCSPCVVQKFRLENKQAEIAVLARNKNPVSRDMLRKKGWRLRSWTSEERVVPEDGPPVFETRFVVVSR